MAPKKAAPKTGAALDAWKAWAASEYNDPAKFQANMVRQHPQAPQHPCNLPSQVLLKAIALFGGSIYILRNYTELFAT